MPAWLHNLLKKLVIAPVRAYQICISPMLPDTCRFEPSCSQYFIEAVEKRGIFVGVCKGCWRILRCNPFCKGGYDPVD